MIAVDSCSFIAYMHDEGGADVQDVEYALQQKMAVFPPVVLTELLSDPELSESFKKILLGVPRLDLTSDFWQRAGALRAKVLAKGFKSRLADVLIAQGCIDHNVSLITRDRDFRHYTSLGGLKLF